MAPFTHMGNTWSEPEYNPRQAIPPTSPTSNDTAGEAWRDSSAPPPSPRSGDARSRKLSLRPPPRDGEKVQAPEFYTLNPAVDAPSRPSLSSVSARSSTGGPSAGTAASRSRSFQPAATSRPQAMVEDMRAASFDHPSGYQQNPYAAQLTPEQRLATEQDDRQEYEQGLPMPNGTHSRRQSTASAVINYLPYLRRNTEDLFEGVQAWLSKNIL
ncbi:MAG: hypothetical protein Q9205_005400 [Flavoplaca limonia]